MLTPQPTMLVRKFRTNRTKARDYGDLARPFDVLGVKASLCHSFMRYSIEGPVKTCGETKCFIKGRVTDEQPVLTLYSTAHSKCFKNA